ncbi:glycosyltransferase 6 [Quercus suber]|uniref:Glycosyltransferase 6 n=1 Tax=Quercus suber TaxID=58331 RepID=A0AAW0LEC9_QUESU
MAKSTTCVYLANTFLFLSLVLFLLLLLWTISSLYNPIPIIHSPFTKPKSEPKLEPNGVVGSPNCAAHELCDPLEKSFYDNPGLSYSIEKPMKNWDEKRSDWLKQHPSFAIGARDRILVVTGSQPLPCENPIGDHLLLRLFKNKVDYCRIHGYDIFYNNAYLHPKMDAYWAKFPVIRAAMLAHPEVEWIWWIDSDAVFTDMEFKVPLDRNCQWSMDLVNDWAEMGPNSPNYEKWGQLQLSTFKDKTYPHSDDQSALIYLLFKHKDKWGSKTYIENEYYFQGYWVEIVKTYENITEGYKEVEILGPTLRRRHAEKLSEYYAKLREPYLEDAGYKRRGRRPFVTHFTGCQQCNGNHNPMYVGDTCWTEMQRALNFADNQVLRNYGFVHPDLMNSSFVSPLPFDYPA